MADLADAAIPPDATDAPPPPMEPDARIDANAPIAVPVPRVGTRTRTSLNIPAWAAAMAGGAAPPSGVTDKQLAAVPDATESVAAQPLAPSDVKIKLPDGTSINLGPSPTPELRAQVKAKILAKFPELGAPPDATTSSTTTTATAPPRMRDVSVDDAGKEINKTYGLPETHWAGKYTAALGKPTADALQDVYDAVTKGGDLSQPGGVETALKLIHPLAVPSEALGNVLFQAATDAGMSPNASALIGTLGALYGGAKTPLPFTTPEAAAPSTTVPPPAPAAEAATAAARDADAARALAESHAAAARDAAAAAERAKAAAAPSTEAATRARLALNPERPLPEGVEGPPAPPVTTQEAGTVLKSATKAGAKSAKDAIQSEYADISSAARDLVLPPRDVQVPGAAPAGVGNRTDQLLTDIHNLRENFGAEFVEPTDAQLAKNPDAKGKWTGGIIAGQQRETLDRLEAAIEANEPIPYPDLEAFKSTIDSLLPGKTPVAATPKVARMYQFKWDFRNLMRDTLAKENPDLAARFDAANTRWGEEIIPHEKFVGGLAKADARAAFARVFGAGTTELNAARVHRALQLTSPAEADTLRSGFFYHLIDKASNAAGETNPAALIKHWDAVNAGVRDALGNKGASTFFDALRSEQAEAARAGEWAGTAEKTAAASEKAAREAATLAERRAKDATAEAEAAAAPVEPRKSKLARLTAEGLVIGAGETIGAAVGHPYLGMIAARHIIPPADLAAFLANSKLATLLARAVKTPANSAVVPALVVQMQKAGLLPQEKADADAEK